MKNSKKACIAAIAITLAGIIAEAIGGMISMAESGVGVSLLLNPTVYVGMGIILLGLIVGCIGYAKSGVETKPALANTALYFAEAAMVFAIVFMIFCIIWPLYNPANG